MLIQELGDIQNFGTMENEKNNKIYKSGELVVDDDLKKVIVEGKEVKLTPTEFNILKFLTKNKGIVYSIDRHIREKIEINPKEPKYLKVIWGIGYKIENI